MVIDTFTGNTYIKSCVDENICLARFEKNITHQVSTTLRLCYDQFTAGFDPQIAFEHYGSGTYRIKLTAYNMYLTVLDSGAVSWGALMSNNTKQVWEFIQTTATVPHTLDIYQCMNQKYNQYDATFNEKGCAGSCVATINGYYGKTPFPFLDLTSTEYNILYLNTVDPTGNGRVYPQVKDFNGGKKANIAYITTNNVNYSTLKSELDNNRPVMLIAKKYSDPLAEGNSSHYVVAYGYKNNCSSESDVLVLDPNNDDNPAEEIGYLCSLSESMSKNKKTFFRSICTTSQA